MVTQHTQWNLNIMGSGRPLSRGHAFAPGGRHYIALFKSQIRVYFLSTRQCIRTIRTPDLSAVVGSMMSKSNPSILYVLLSTGEVLVVNWKDKGSSPIVGTFQLEIPEGSAVLSVEQIVNSEMGQETFITIVGKQSSTRSPHTRTLLRTLRQGSTELFAAKNITLYARSNDASKYVFLSSKNELIYVTVTEGTAASMKVPFAYKTPIVSLAVCDGLVALGAASGIIQLVYTEDSTQRLLKWHIDQVKALRFSNDDAYLLSGGLEKVLVFWQLDTDRQQFLPRLNGPIEDIEIETSEGELYVAKISLNETQDLEFLVLSAVDLTSRLNVTGLRPKLASSLATIENSKKKMNKKGVAIGDATALRNDCTAPFEVHPTSKLLYVPFGSQIQAFDVAKNEQAFVQNVAFAIQAGKVRAETLIADPSVDLLSFTNDGMWMCTFDSLPTPQLDNLLSGKETKYALKFWKYVGAAKDNSLPHWELSTKVVDPHGPQTAVLGVVPAPEGHAFLTVDNRGGVRVWKPRVPKDVYMKAGTITKNERLQQTTWSLRKVRHGNDKHSSKSVAVAWSHDMSLIALGHETSVVLLDASTMVELETPQLPALAGSRVRWVQFFNNNLLVASKDRFVTFDLASFQNNNLAIALTTPPGGHNLIAVNEDFVALAVNHYTESYSIESDVFLFRPDSLEPVFRAHHDVAIASLRYSIAHESFVFIDVDARVGVVSNVVTLSEQDSEIDYAYEMNVLLQNARAVSSYTSSSTEYEEAPAQKVLSPNTFDTVLNNIDGIKLETLFENVMKII